MIDFDFGSCPHTILTPLPPQADGSQDARCEGCGDATFPLVDKAYESFRVEEEQTRECLELRETFAARMA